MWVLVAVIVALTIAVSLGTMDSYSQQKGQISSNKQDNRGNEDLSKYASVDYDEPALADADEREKRKQKNKRYDNQFFVRGNPHPDTGAVGRTVETPLPPAIPVLESDLIVVGEVVSANAHLSNDKTGIYTEFNALVEEPLKYDTSDKTIQKGRCISVDRAGGFVRYSNGRKVLYRITGRDLPRIGYRYLLFLQRDQLSPNYKILTGYELNEESVGPLDREIQLDKYQGFGEAQFLQVVRDEISKLTISTEN